MRVRALLMTEKVERLCVDPLLSSFIFKLGHMAYGVSFHVGKVIRAPQIICSIRLSEASI